MQLHDKLKILANAFCPTGPGGGQDNSCSPSHGGYATDLKPIKSMKRIDISGTYSGNLYRAVNTAAVQVHGKASAKFGMYVTDSSRIAKMYGSDVKIYQANELKVLGYASPEFDAMRSKMPNGVTIQEIKDRAAKLGWDAINVGGTEGIVILGGKSKRIVANAFCPTGEGGGIDPTCGSKDSNLADDEKSWREASDNWDNVTADPNKASSKDLYRSAMFGTALERAFREKGKQGAADAIRDEMKWYTSILKDRGYFEDKPRTTDNSSDEWQLQSEVNLGWDTYARPVDLATPSENTFCPTGKGGGIDPTCQSVFHGTAGELRTKIKKEGLIPSGAAVNGRGVYAISSQSEALRYGMIHWEEKHLDLYEQQRREGKQISDKHEIVVFEIQRSAFNDPHPNMVVKSTRKIPSSAIIKTYRYKVNDLLTKYELNWKKAIPWKVENTTPNTCFVVWVVDEHDGHPIDFSSITSNAFCPTGPGGGQDNSCSGKKWDVFKVGNISVIKNPTDTDHAEMRRLFYEKYPMAPVGSVKIRSTIDTEGNKYSWMSDKSHSDVEPEIDRRYNTHTHQSGLFDLKYNSANDRTENAFCPTGKGGGVDPTCSPGGRAVTKTPEFKKWFGKSKVVDDKGEPLVVYHGTNQAFTEFGSRKGWTTTEHFFTEDPDLADTYASGATIKGSVGANIIPVYLRIEKPTSENKMSLHDAKNSNHDGIIGKIGGKKYYIVWNPNQIKSATGNRGTFDFSGIITHSANDNGHIHNSNSHVHNAKTKAKQPRRIFGKKPIQRKLSKKKSPTRIDPTRLATLRRVWTTDLRRRFKSIDQALYQLLVKDDAFGLEGKKVFNVFCATGTGGGVDPSCGKNIGQIEKTEHSWKNEFDVGKQHYTFLAEKRLYVGQDESDPDASDTWEVGFFAHVGGETFGEGKVDIEGLGITGTGNQVQVLTRAHKSLTEFIVEKKPAKVFFGASELNRQRLYAKMANRLIPTDYERLPSASNRFLFKRKVVTNVFCATGQGGGIDPSCSSSSSKEPLKFAGYGVDVQLDPGYNYHVTTAERAYDIANTGKLVPHKPSYGTDQGAWPDSSTEKRSYLTAGKPMWEFSPEEGKPVALRIKDSAVLFKKESTGDVYYNKSIPSKHIEIALADGSWTPLDGLKSLTENYDVAKEVERAARETDTNPSDAARAAGNYRKGQVWVQGLEVSVETPRGATRRGIGADGEPWEHKLKDYYGYIKLTKSEADGDHMDCFLGPNLTSDKVFVIDQTRPCLTENAFCATGKGGGIDPSCSPRDSEGKQEHYEQSMQGEFWLQGSSAVSANGDIDDMNHEAHAVQQAQYDVAEAFGVDLNDDDWDKAKEEIVSKIVEEQPELQKQLDWFDQYGAPSNPEQESHVKPFYDKLKEFGVTQEDWEVAHGNGNQDSRTWAASKHDWVRVAGNSIQMVSIDGLKMSEIADGLYDAYGEDVEKQSFDLEVIAKDSVGSGKNIYTKMYTDVPYHKIASGSLSALREYVTNVACREFDEHKVMIGWDNAEEAKQAYHNNFSEGWQGFSGITEMTMDEFKQWLKEGDSGKPVMNSFCAMTLNQKLQLLADDKSTLVFNSSYFATCERDEKGQCLPSGDVEDKGSEKEDFNEPTKDVVESTGKFDRAKWQGKREEWSKLSVGQRDDLANAESGIKGRISELLKGVPERPNTGNLEKDLGTRINQLSDRVHPQAADRMKTVARDYTNLMNEAGVKPEHQHDLAMEAVDHLAAQESETMTRQLGDHGVAHIKGDIDVAMQTMDALPIKATAKDKLAAYTACIYHDTGYLTEPSRSFLDEGHPRWSEQHYNTNVRPLVAKALGNRAADEVSHIISTHDATDMDWKNDSVASSVRLADNLAVFHREKLPPVFRYVNGNINVLKDLGAGKIDKATANERMVANIAKSNLSDKVKSQLRLGAKEVSEYTPKVTLGMLGGTLTGVKYKDDMVVAEVKESKKATEINKLGDFGQNQLAKLAKTFDADPKQFQKDLNFTFKGKDGRARLRIEMAKSVENVLLNAGERFQFLTSPEQVNSFREFLKKLLQQYIVDENVNAEDQWFQQYVEEGYRKGAGRAWDDTRPSVKKWMNSDEANKKLDFYDGTRADFLRSSFARPVSVEKVKLLAGRSFTDLKGISDQMNAKLIRGLTDGLVQGKNSKQMYKDLAREVGISESRAEAIAQTELTRAHASGQLQSFRDLGVTRLGVMAEWKTADDDRVCDECDAMNGTVMTVDEAEGMIPRHPNCFVSPRVKIYTADGWKPISRVEVGDLVLTHLGRFQKVIQTHRNMGYQESLVEFKIGFSQTSITVTEGHPVRVNGKWIPAKDIKPGDRVHWLSTNCKGCGKILPYGLKYCGVECQWKNKEHRANITKKNSEANLRQYASGERDGHACTEAAHNRVRELLALGEFRMPRLSGDANPAKRPEVRRKIRDGKLGDKNPMRMHPEIGKANGQALAQYCKDHPEKHANHIVNLKGHRTKIELIMESELHKLGLCPDSEYQIGRLRVDFAFPEHKLVVECDGAYWHQDAEKDQLRDQRLEKEGWTVLHFTEEQVYETPKSCASKVKRVLKNHTGQYKFALFEVAEVNHRESGRVVLFNLSVNEDESYIAKGCVVHNCRCALLPANVGEEDDNDNQQIRGKSAIERAIEDSLDAEGRGDKTTWPGADVSISKVRPEGIFNSQNLLLNYQQGQSEIIDRLDQVIDLLGITDSSLPLIDNVENTFCPTGKGGGVDPSCSPQQGITEEDKENFASWTDQQYNPSLSETERGRLRKVYQSISKLPNYRGEVYRIVTLNPGEQFQGGSLKRNESVWFDRPYSTTKDKEYTDTMLDGLPEISKPGSTIVYMTMEVKSGADLSPYDDKAAYSGQQEVVTRPGTMYVVHQVRKTKLVNGTSLLQVHLKEAYRSEQRESDWLKMIENRSFFAECERDEHGHCLPEGTSESKSQAATRTYKPSTVEKQRKGEAEQLLLSKAIGGINTDDNKPFDVLVGSNGVEVKCVIDNDNDKITVHPESRIRKEQEAKRLKLKTHTVAIDTRSGRRVYYYRSGVGAFRLSSMERVSLTKLKEILS